MYYSLIDSPTSFVILITPHKVLSGYHTSVGTTVLLVAHQGYNEIYNPMTSHKRVVAGILGSLHSLVSLWCYVQIPKESGHSQGEEGESGSGSGGSYRLPVATGSRYGCE